MDELARFKETFDAPAYAMSQPWWALALARSLAERGYLVRTGADIWNTFPHVSSDDTPATNDKKYQSFDLLTWRSWSEYPHDDELYGTDEPTLPPIHLVRLLFDQDPGHPNTRYSDYWERFSNLSRTIKGPLRLSLAVVNRVRGEHAWIISQGFKHQMSKAKASAETTTQIGEAIGTYIYEPLESFQFLLASKTWERRPVSNPHLKKHSPRRRR